MIRSRFVASAAACALLAGCTAPPAPSPTSTPTPTFSCTPEAGGTAYECSQFDYEQMVAKDKLYAEAEAVYRKFFAEDERIYRAGGVDEPTPVLLETTTGRYLRDSMSLYRALREHQARLATGSPNLVSLQRLPGVGRDGSVVAMAACVDARSVQVQGQGGYESRGSLYLERLYFASTGQSLKVNSSQWKELESC